MLHIGTSGWQYADWRGDFYPAGLPQRLWLEHYTGTFGTVEVNSAFYRLPERDTFRRWAEQTPPDFVVAVKVSRYLTHINAWPIRPSRWPASSTGPVAWGPSSVRCCCSCRPRWSPTRGGSTRR